MRNEGTIKNTDAVGFIVSTWAKGVKEGGQAESRAGRLGLTSQIRFGGSDNDFFLRVHSSGDTRNEVCDLSFRDQLCTVPSLYLFRLFSFLD